MAATKFVPLTFDLIDKIGAVKDLTVSLGKPAHQNWVYLQELPA